MAAETIHPAPPVAGYQSIPDWKLHDVNHLKAQEERLLRQIDRMMLDERIDPRWAQIGRTHLQQGFMALARSIFQPSRIEIPEDHQFCVHNVALSATCEKCGNLAKESGLPGA